VSEGLSAAARAAVEAIQMEDPVVLPTDTVYGLCATADRPEAARRLYRLKGRPESTPTALVCSDLDLLLECVPELGERSARLARALLPGPFTLVFPNPARRYHWMTGAFPETIGVRVPVLRGDAADVLGHVGALMATSANLPGGPEPRRLEEVPAEIRAGCSALLDGGKLPGIPSTVLDLTGPEPRVVREGAVPAAEALEHVGRALSHV
jgi:L-threonylcarbamoyladenylate synthase